MVAEGPRIGVSGDDRLLADIEDVIKTGIGDMGNVNQHSQTIHFLNDFDPEPAKTCGFFFCRSIGHIVSPRPGETHHLYP